MPSQRQLEANKANARRSTGPRTSNGKTRSRMNAVKHGLTAKYIVIGNEAPDDFDALRRDLLRDLQASTRLEHELVDRLAGLLWRLRRIPILEAALVKACQSEVRDETEARQERDYGERLEREARHRYATKYGNGSYDIQKAIIDGSYDARMEALRQEVLAEWKGDDSMISGQHDDEPSTEPDGATTLLMLVRDLENADGLGKLNRYETTLMNAFTRTLQQLHVLRNFQGAMKLIST